VRFVRLNLGMQFFSMMVLPQAIVPEAAIVAGTAASSD
jgi:hypothetical protein